MQKTYMCSLINNHKAKISLRTTEEIDHHYHQNMLFPHTEPMSPSLIIISFLTPETRTLLTFVRGIFFIFLTATYAGLHNIICKAWSTFEICLMESGSYVLFWVLLLRLIWNFRGILHRSPAFPLCVLLPSLAICPENFSCLDLPRLLSLSPELRESLS